MKTTTGSPATVPREYSLEVGHQVRFAETSRLWWVVRSTSSDGRWVVLTQQEPFAPAGQMRYTIIDWERGVRGPCNLIGQGWDFMPGTSAEQSADRLIHALEVERSLRARLEQLPPGQGLRCDEIGVEVSHRNNVPIVIVDVRTRRQ